MKSVEDTPMENFARLAWSAHILRYLSQTRDKYSYSQKTLGNDNPTGAKSDLGTEEDNLDESGSSDEEVEHADLDTDGASDVNATLAKPDSIRTKFLDHLAQTLSRSRGWHQVTTAALREFEDRVEVDVAKTGGFDDKDSCYIEELERFFKDQKGYAANDNSGLSHFQERTILHYSRRLKGTITGFKRLEKLRSAPLPNAYQAIKPVAQLLETIDVSESIEDSDLVSIVRLAYDTAELNDPQPPVTHNTDRLLNANLWRHIHFLARPISACNAFRDVIEALPKFRNIHFISRTPQRGIQLPFDLVVTLQDALQSLGLSSFTGNQTFSPNFRREFSRSIAKEFAVHAEVQLLQLYEKNTHLCPTTSVIGCSKKSCLLCEKWLKQSTLGLSTTKRHGKIYPAWAIPMELLETSETRLSRLLDTLVQRIKDLLYNKDEILAQAVAESTIVSKIDSTNLIDVRDRQRLIEQRKKQQQELETNHQLMTSPTTLASNSGSSPSNRFYDASSDCVICGASGSKLESRCRSVRYCKGDSNKSCQNADWPSHKLLCRSLKEQSPRPSQHHKRAIYFPQDADKPRLEWVKCEMQNDELDGPWEKTHFGSLMGSGDPLLDRHFITRNARRVYDLANAINVVCRDAFSKDGSKRNRSLLGSLGHSESLPFPWRGPIVCLSTFGWPHTGYGFIRHEDITLADFRHILDYFATYNDDSVYEREGQSKGHDSVWGVRVNCSGEQLLHGVDEFVRVEVPSRHPAHPARKYVNSLDCETSSISKLVGLPIRGFRMPFEHNYDQATGEHPGMTDSNVAAMALFKEANITSDRWGFGPMLWNLALGNILLVRDDEEDLDVKEAQLLSVFCQEKVSPMFEDTWGAGFVERTRQEVVDFITPENFEAFKREMQAKEEQSG